MTLEEYKTKILGDLKMPLTLEKLFLFEEEEGGLYYCNKFELSYEDISGVDIDDCEEEYYKSIKPFAYVDDGCCALWIKDSSINLEDAPIIYYSSEGMIRIMAKNLKTFLRMLTFDSHLNDGTFYKFKEDYVESKYKAQYIQWLKKEFNLNPVEELPNDERYGESPENMRLTQEAEEMYKTDFIDWHQQFCDIEGQYYDE